MKIDRPRENVERFGVLAMQMQTKCKLALEMVFHQRGAPPVSAAATLTKL